VQAIVAYERAIGEDDADELAYEALDRLYALERRLEDLARVLARRIELAVDPATRVEIGLRLGELFDRSLHQPEQAIAALQRVIEDEPSNRAALTSIASLFEREGMWPELLENFGQQQSIADGVPERVALLHRSGEVLEQRIGDVDGAIDSYRSALELDPQHEKALDALVRIARLPEHRSRAAEIAEPLLRSRGRYDDLVALIEGGIPGIDDAVGRRSELQRLAELHEHSRANLGDAFDTLCRALDEDPTDDSVLADLERLARTLGRWERLAEVLGREAGTTPDTTVGAGLFRRLARIYEEELHDDARAIDAFVAAESRDDTPETLLALDRLYLRTERWAELLEVLDRRVGASADPTERTDLLLRLGNLHVERFDDGRGAFVAFKEILDQDPADPRALAAMEALGTRDALARDVLDVLDDSFRQIGALDRLAGLYDIRIRLAETDPERIRLLNDAARIWEDELKDPARALVNARRVFELDPSDDHMLDEVERLADASSSWAGVRGMVESAIKGGAVEGQRKRALALRAAGWYRDRLGDPESEERCLRWSLEVDPLDPSQLDVHERVIALLRDPGREADLVAALRNAADADRDVDTRKDRLREAAGLAERTLRDLQLAGACLTSLLDVDPKDAEALTELASIRTTEGRFEDVVALLERRIEIENDADERAALRMRMAEILDQQLNRPERAVAAYQALLEELPTHAAAQAALEQLFERSERYEELLALLQRRLPQEGSDDVRAQLHLRIASVAEERLGDSKRAIDELRTVLREQPDHPRALAELERLLAKGERWPELITLLNQRAARAAEQGDRPGELDYLRKIAALTEEKLGNPDQAVVAYNAVCERDPSDRAAREALVRLRSAGAKWGEAALDMRALLDLLSGDALVENALRLADLAERRLDDLALAESALLRALEAAPDHVQALEQIKALYERTKAHDKLVRVLAAEEQRLQDSGQRVLLLNRIAALYREKLGDPGSAVGFLERAVALVPDDREALLQLCDLYIAAGRARDAIPVLEKIVASYGGRRAKEVATYQHRLGQAYEGLGETDKALEHFDAAFKIDLTNVAILRDLGRLCLQKGDLDRAQKTYRALLLQKLGADSGIAKADVYYCLGEISFKQNDKVKAKAMLERAIAEAGEHAAAKAMLEQL
jgi:tetratricopeptide (TPR) repeat protein